MRTQRSGPQAFARAVALTLAVTALGTASAQADPGHFPPSYPGHGLAPGNLLVSRSVYENDPNLTAGVTELPAGCVTDCVLAKAGGAYPEVWNNELGGRKLRRHLEDLPRPAHAVGIARQHAARCPTAPTPGIASGADQMITSFSSKSELALNLSTQRALRHVHGLPGAGRHDRRLQLQHPGVIDPTNPDTGAYYRVVAQLEQPGPVPVHRDQRLQRQQRTRGDPQRRTRRARDLHGGQRRQRRQPAAGRDHRGRRRADPQALVRTGAGALQEPGFPTPVGSFNVTQLGDKADKIGKDTNFRGLTIYNNVIYYTKGSGSNGVNTVYFLDTTGKACPNGVGLPAPNAKLPSVAAGVQPRRRSRPKA